MKARGRTVLGKASLATAAALFCALTAGAARADRGSGTSCTLRGVTHVAANTPIYGADGQAVARFSGAASALSAASFPTDPRGRVKIETGTGSGSFRVYGLMNVEQLPVFTTENVPVVPGHVWIGADRRVTVVGAAPGRLKVQRVVTAQLQQTFTTWGPCSAFTLSDRGAAPSPVPARARGFILERPSLDLYASGDADSHLIVTLLRAPIAEKVLFFGTEQRGPWLRVEHHGEIEVDAWAKLSDLTPLPPGETLDELAPLPPMQPLPRLAVQGEPQSVETKKEVPLRRTPKDGAPVIGVIEIGTPTYVLDVVAGWASVMPKALNVVPVEDGQFWVKASDLGL